MAAMKSMKVMKAMKAKAMKPMKKAAMKAAMKAMKKKAMKKSTIGRGIMAKSLVLKGSRVKTSGGLTAKDIIKNKNGKCVSKKMHARGLKNPFMLACKAARKALGIKGFCPVGGKTPEGKALYAKAKSLLR